MRRISVGFLLLAGSVCQAIPITLFMDTDTFIERAKDIVIAKCVSKEDIGPVFDGLTVVNTEVLVVLKGDKKPGKLRVATIYHMEIGSRYMLASLGGQAYKTDFLALPQLSVVPIPDDFPLERLKGRSVKQQLQMVFARQLFEVEKKLEPLLGRKALLEKALEGREDDVYKSAEEVRIDKVLETAADEADLRGLASLDLQIGKMNWSRGGEKTGYLYLEDPDKRVPAWEFAPSDKREIEAFNGKILVARFYGWDSPGGDAAFGTRHGWGGGALTVEEGQVLLARRVADPSVVVILKIERQHENKVQVKYVIIR